MVLALAITVNLILTGPMYSMVTLATGRGKVSEENVTSATQLCENIADEGIVLLDNDGTLPMAKNSKLNVLAGLPPTPATAAPVPVLCPTPTPPSPCWRA